MHNLYNIESVLSPKEKEILSYSFGMRKLKGKKIGIFRPESLYIEKKELM